MSFWVKEGLKYSGQEFVDDILFVYFLVVMELWFMFLEFEKVLRVFFFEGFDFFSENFEKN